MNLRSIIAGVAAIVLSTPFAFAQSGQGSSPLTIAKGGTNASTATNARTQLGLAIGSNVQAWDTDLDCLAALSSAGIVARTGSGACAVRTLTAPAAGFTITNPAGTAGDPTFVLANDLAAVEALASTGFAVRTATDTWAQRTITGTANEITVTNGDGVAGNPTLSLPAALTFTTKTITGGSFASPALTGTPTAPTASPSSNSTQIATTAYVDAQVVGGTAGVASIDTATGAITISGMLTRSSQDLRVTAAAQSDQETGSSTALAVTPGRQQFHPSAAKAWVSFTGSTGAILASHNVTSVTRTGAGLYTVNFTTAFSSANYAAVFMSGAAGYSTGGNANQLAGSIDIRSTNLGGTNTDVTQGFAIFFGDQ